MGIAANIGERALFMAAHAWSEQGLLASEISTERLAAWFAKALAHADTLEAQAARRPAAAGNPVEAGRST